MDAAMKTPDRINYTKKAHDIIDKIDNEEYFGLNRSSISRSELFLFAMSLGTDGVPLKLDNVYAGGLALDSSIDARTKSLMYALYIGHLGTRDIDEISQKSAVYNLAQEYANTGFHVIEDYMGKKKDIDLMWEIIAELDEQYHLLVGEENSNISVNP